MKCQECQQKILDSFASGANQVSPEVAAHQQFCCECAKFGAEQKNLFHAIDAGLQSIIDQPVPPSLLRTIRARLGTVDHPNFAFPAWVSVAALVLFAFLVSAPFLLRTSSTSVRRVVLRSTPVESVKPESATVTPNNLPVPPPRKNHAAVGEHDHTQLVSRPARSQGLPDGNEKQALAALADLAVRHPDWGNALLHPAQLPVQNTAVRRIEIARLELTPITHESW
jgi:hypothetical protein